METYINYLYFIGVVIIAILGLILVAAIFFRRVVATNMVHIVQSAGKTTDYGTGMKAGNVYYQWPSWIPRYGVTYIKLPVSNFDVSLEGYKAYDKDRVPFMVDVTAFFRINDTSVAAQRIASVRELEKQLQQIVEGSIRKVLASDVIDKIMLERAKFGTAFTEEVSGQLEQWGVEPVKSMELMDIRDGDSSKVITNIMAKKTSHIEMESRKEVAKNMKEADVAEIEAKQVVDVRKEHAQQAVGERTAEKDKMIGVAEEQAQQKIAEEQKTTSERDMDIIRVKEVRQADITKEQEVVMAEQDKETTVIIAEGVLEAKRKEAQGIEAEGSARAAAEKAMQLAPVEAQIVLAKEIGKNKSFQEYLVSIEGIKTYEQVGTEQAKALQVADIKVIANTGNATEGVGNVMDLFTSKGGTQISSMVEALAQTPMGKALLDKVVGITASDDDTATTATENIDSASDTEVTLTGDETSKDGGDDEKVA